jgi:IclR family transcriptional regulator, acetate operon repressor
LKVSKQMGFELLDRKLMRKKKMKSSPVGVIRKVLSILELLNTVPDGLQLSQIAEDTGINKSTAHRFLSHLESEAYLFRDASGNYMLGAKLSRLGSGASFQSTLSKVARPVMENLRKMSGETVNLAVLDGTEVLYIDVLETVHTFRLVTQIGSHLPFYSTSLGKAMVAAIEDTARLDDLLSRVEFERTTPRSINSLTKLKKQLAAIRQQGYALDDEEAVAGVRCVGAPIVEATGEVVAAISISAPVVRFTSDRVPMFSRELKKAAREISWLLANRHPETQSTVTLPKTAKRSRS